MSREGTATGWNVALPALGLVLLLLLVLYRDTTLYLAGLWAEWKDGGYSHGYLVLLMCAYIIYSMRATLARMVPCPCMPALLAVAGFGLLWSLASMASIQVLQTVALLPLVMSVIWAMLGTQLALKLLLPVMFIGFALPVWSPFLPVLQIITADSAFWMTRVAGIPAYMQDFTITLPSGRLSIHEACSGLHYLLAGVTLSVFYAWLNYRRTWHRLLVVMITAGAAILANVLRVFIITWLAYRTDMQHPYVEDHLSLGWYLFGGLVFVLLLVDLLLGRHVAEGRDARGGAAANSCKYGNTQRLAIFSVTAALVASGPVVAGWVIGQARPASVQELQLPDGLSGWQGPVATNDSWQPVYQGAVSKTGVYRKAGASIYLYVGYYPRQSQGVELINVLNRIANVDAWQVGRSDIIDLGQDRPRIIESELVSLSAEKRLVWYRYRVAGRYTTNANIAKVLQVVGMLAGEPGASVVAMATDVDADVQAARERLAGFMLSMDESLVRTADGGL